MFVSASTNWRSSTRRVKKYFVCALVVLCAFAVSGAAFSQPPRPGGDRSGWNNRGGRPGGDNRGGRTGDNRGGRPGGNAEGERGQNGPQEGDFQEQGIPGQGGDFQEEGQQQEGWVQEGPQQQEGWGQEGPQPPQQQEGWGDPRNQGGEQGGDPRDQRRNREPRVSLEDALKNADGVTPIQLNQNDFTASDGVRLTGVYFKGKGDQDTPVVVLLHDLKGKSDSYMPVAQLLAQQGFGVLVPNLRGEGGSGALQRGPGNNNPPNDRPQMQQQISPRDINAMINLDREVWFTFLAYLNNLQYCNVKKTVIVGSGFGAALAASWAKSDWISKGTVAQNVVGLVLLSPDADNGEGKYNSLVSLEAVRKRAKFPTLGYLIFVGKMDEEKFKDAQEIQQKMGGKVADESTPMEDRACPLVALQTELQGDELLGFESFGVSKTIVQYVALRMKKLPKKRDKWEEIVEKKSRRN